MTSTWDTVQSFLGALGKLKNDPDLYETGIEYISNLISEIHEYDHQNDQDVSRAIDRTSAMEDIRKLLRGQRS